LSVFLRYYDVRTARHDEIPAWVYGAGLGLESVLAVPTTAGAPTLCGPSTATETVSAAWRDALLEGLGYVWLEVHDLQRSVTFYRDGLRFVEGPETNGVVVHLRAGDLHLILSESLEMVDQRGEGVALAVEVSGVDAYHDALVARGLEPSRPQDDGNRRSFTVMDPDGYEWRFTQGP
jgi:catechol 2,3-dioxygenase-like lactoylglutathione lyase family enzyme